MRKILKFLFGCCFGIAGISFLVSGFRLFGESGDWASLIVNLLGSGLFLFLGVSFTGSLGWILDKKNVTFDPYQVGFVVTAVMVSVSFLCGIGLLGYTLWLAANGQGLSAGLLIAGAMFAGVPTIFILVYLFATDRLSLERINWIELAMGAVLLIAGGGALYLICDTYTFAGAVKEAGLLPLIPILLAVVGILVIVRSLRRNKDT